MSAVQLIEKHKFGETTSTIGIRFGRVFVYNQSTFEDVVWYVVDGEKIEWLEKFRKKEDIKEFDEVKDLEYLDMSVSARLDWVLKNLMGVSQSCGSDEWKNAVIKNKTAIKWVNNLSLAKDKLDWWYADGCKLDPDELEIVQGWSKKETTTQKASQERAIAANILHVRRKAQEMNAKDESTRN